MTFETLEHLLDRFGWPGTLLLLIAVALWLSSRKLAAWGEPLAREFITAHTSLARKLEANLDEQTEGHAKTHGKLDLIAGDVREIRGRVLPGPGGRRDRDDG